MTKDELINEVQKNEYKDICRKILPKFHLDLYQELVITALEKEDKIVEGIRNARFYLVGILYKMAHGNRSPFRKKYGIGFERELNAKDLLSNEDEENGAAEEKLIRLEKAMESEGWFDKELFNLLIEHGSYSKLEAATKIDSTFAFRTISKFKKRINIKMKVVKLLLIATRKDDALKYHRQVSPHARLLKTNEKEIEISMRVSEPVSERGDREATIDDMTDEELSQFNIIYYLRQISFKGGREKETIDRCHRLGIKVILDIDDNWRLSSNHRMYEIYKQARKHIETAIKEVDHVITTTDYFANVIRELNQNVTVFPNCINPDDPQFNRRDIASPRIRFGWIGGVYHRQDIEAMDATFCKLYRDKEVRDKTQICLGGFNYPNPEYEAIEKSMSCNYDWRHSDATYQKYLLNYTSTADHISYDKPYRRMWARDVKDYGGMYNEIDVALVPLKPDKFNGCKSELKIVEAGWMGKAVIVNDVLPYSNWIKHGVNGLKVSTGRSIDWYLNIKKLAMNPTMIKDLGAGLEETIKTHFNMDKHNERRLQLYKSLI